MNGVEVHQRVRQLQTDTVGILVTALAGQDTVNDASAAGMHRVLPKPVDFDRLLCSKKSLANQVPEAMCDYARDFFSEV